jgi:hypothetical protein
MYWKINADSKLVFLWCSDLQIRSAAEADGGGLSSVPRPYNHNDERPCVCYASEQDRLQRITAVPSFVPCIMYH